MELVLVICVLGGLAVRFSSSVISFLLAVLVPGFASSVVAAGQGCCGGGSAIPVYRPVIAAPVQFLQPLVALPVPVATPAPCCGGSGMLPVAVYPSAHVVPPGYHVQHPYYNYRAPWNGPGPAVLNRAITW